MADLFDICRENASGCCLSPALFRLPTSIFFDEFFAYLESVLLCNYKERLLICGDFNVDSVDDPDSVKFRDLLESVRLRQRVKKSTHNNGHILDY